MDDPLDIFAECKECYAKYKPCKFGAVIFLCHNDIMGIVLFWCLEGNYFCKYVYYKKQANYVEYLKLKKVSRDRSCNTS